MQMAMAKKADIPRLTRLCKYQSRDEIRKRISAWEAAEPQYFAQLRKRYGKPKAR